MSKLIENIEADDGEKAPMKSLDVKAGKRRKHLALRHTDGYDGVLSDKPIPIKEHSGLTSSLEKLTIMKYILDFLGVFSSKHPILFITLLIIALTYAVWKGFGMSPGAFLGRVLEGNPPPRRWNVTCIYAPTSNALVEGRMSKEQAEEIFALAMTFPCDFPIIQGDLDDGMRKKFEGAGFQVATKRSIQGGSK